MAVSPSPAPVPPPVNKQPVNPPPHKVSTATVVLSILFLALLCAAVIIVVFLDQIAVHPFVNKLLKLQNIIVLPTVAPSPTPKPTPSYLPPGKETYMIGKTFEEGFPNITMLTLDPINITNGDQQTIEVTVTSPTPVTSVEVTLYADDKNKQVTQLTLAKGETSTIWRGSWTATSSVWYRYVIMIKATNALGESKAYVAIRTMGPLKKSGLD